MRKYKVKIETASGRDIVITLDEAQLELLAASAINGSLAHLHFEDGHEWYINTQNIVLYDISEG